MTVGELKAQLSRYDDDMKLIFINHPYRGSSVVFNVDDPDEVSAAREPYSGLIADREDFEDHLVFPVYASNTHYRLEDDNDWPGRD